MNLSIFFQRLSKLMIDEIVGTVSPMENRVLAHHPMIPGGFTAAELGDRIT